ncbi:hypothetical protein [Rubrivirga sp.]|uniref:hypothetical protein n=1 Tax=Rubrivirga sp. TaxID=1885344 RepID=UPI003C7062AB
MTVTEERFDDHSDPGAEFSYRYVGTISRSEDEGRILIARAYDDTPKRISFMRWQDARFGGRRPRGRVFDRAVRYAREALGKTDVRFFGHRGYVRVEG